MLMYLLATPCTIPLNNLYREDILKTQNIDQVKNNIIKKGSSETLYSDDPILFIPTTLKQPSITHFHHSSSFICPICLFDLCSTGKVHEFDAHHGNPPAE